MTFVGVVVVDYVVYVTVLIAVVVVVALFTLYFVVVTFCVVICVVAFLFTFVTLLLRCGDVCYFALYVCYARLRTLRLTLR